MKFLVISILFYLALRNVLQAADTGFQNPSVCVSSTTGGSATWSNPSNALTQNNTYATAATNSSDTRYLYCYGYPATIPANATITGIQLRLYRKNVSCEDVDITDNIIKVVKNNTVVGNNQNTSFTWGCSDGGAFTFPHPDPVIDSLWGTTFTPSEMNDSSMGYVVSFVDSGGSVTGGVDAMQRRIYYDLTPHIGIETQGVYFNGVRAQ